MWEQAVHIFWKDARYLRREIGLVLGFTGLFAAAAASRGYAGWAQILLAACVAYLIAALVQAEAVPGDRQFWITRPYRRSSLLAAKLLGLVVFVNLPILAARAFVYVMAGFPLREIVWPLVWSQSLILVGVTVPMAALAAVTNGLGAYAVWLLMLMTLCFGIPNTVAPPAMGAVRMLLTSSQWVWHWIAMLSAIAFAIPVLYLQYSRRSTLLSRCVIVAVAVVGAAAYIYTPWPVAAAIESRVSGRGFDADKLRVELNPEAKRFLMIGMMWRGGAQVDVPLAIRGVPEDVELVPDAIALTFEAPNGWTWTSGPYRYPAITKLVEGRGPVVLNANVDIPLEFFAQTKTVKVRGALYLTAFGNVRARTVAVRGSPVSAGDGLHCAATAFQRFACWSAFRWPDRLVYARFGDGGLRPFARSISYSPAPAGIELFTVVARDVAMPSGAQEVSIEVAERLRSFRKDFEIAEFPLSALGKPVATSTRRE